MKANELLIEARQFPSMDELPSSQLAFLAEIDRISTVKVGDTWKDDHALAFNTTFVAHVGSKTQRFRISWWWMDPQALGIFNYANDSATAQKKAVSLIRYHAADYYEEVKAEEEQGNRHPGGIPPKRLQ